MKRLLHETYYHAVDTQASSLSQTTTDASFSGMDVISVSGILVDGKRNWSLLPSNELPVRSLVADIVDSSGEWTAIAVSREKDRARYLIFGDYAGYAPIFYSLLPRKALVVSDSFNGVVQGMLNLGGTTTLNLGNYLTLITGRSATFETLISHHTMANEIRILGPDEALVVDNDKVSIIERSRLSDVSQISSYDEAMSAALTYASQSIANFASQNQGMQPLLTLTGGVDSRLVLALLKTTSYLRDFRVWTMDPRKAKNSYQERVYRADVEISNQIRKAYKLDWMPPRSREKISISFEEALARHQSFYSNYSFKFSPSTHLSIERTPILTLRGGGGELLRGTGGARLASKRYSQYRRDGGQLEQVRWAANDYIERSFLTDDMRPIVQDFVVRQLNRYTDPLLRGKLDSFYRETRNRAHFGHHRSSESLNDYLLQALSNPYFQRVVDLAGYDYASSNGLVRDIFNLTEPNLRKFPFENATAHDELHLSPRKPFKYKERDSWIDDFDALAALGTSIPYRFMGRPEERGARTQTNVRETGLNFLRQGFSVIESGTPAEYKKSLAAQHRRVFEHVKRNHIPLGRAIAIVASALDAFTPMPLDNARHFFTHYGTQSIIPSRDILLDAAEPYSLRLTGSDHTTH